MNKRIEYQGAPINIPEVLSGIQSLVEDYFEKVISTVLTTGVIRSSSNTTSPPARLYTSGITVQLSAGSVIFPDYKVMEVSGTMVETVAALNINTNYYVWATLGKVNAGIQKKVSNKFVYNADLLDSYPSQINDSVVYHVTKTVPTGDYILLGVISYSPSWSGTLLEGQRFESPYFIDQRPGITLELAQLKVLPKHSDSIIELNTDQVNIASSKAGLKIRKNNGDIVSFMSDGSEFESSLPIKAASPTEDDHLTTKLWVESYIYDLLYYTPSVLNFRVSDISTVYDYNFNDPTLSNKISAGVYDQQFLKVSFDWGYNDIAGSSSGNDIFIISNKSFSNDALKGYYLWFPSINKNALISTNTGNTCTLKEVTGEDFVFPTPLTIDAGSESCAWIHSNADEYQIYTQVYKAGYNPTPKDTQVHHTVYSEGVAPTIMHTDISLPIGRKYTIKIRGTRGNGYSSWASLIAGSFNKFYQTSGLTVSGVEYLSPLLVDHPDIPVGTGTITAGSTISGFNIEIPPTLWPDAQAFEIIYLPKSVLGGGSLTFASSANNKIFNTRQFEIATNVSALYAWAIRPLIGNMEVSSPKTGEVMTSSQAVSNLQAIANYNNIELRSFQGTISYASGVEWEFNTIETPAILGNAVEADLLSKYYDNKILKMGTVEYIISSTSSNKCVLLALSNPNIPYMTTPGTYSFTIGATKRSRRIARLSNIAIDYRIVRVDIDCHNLKDNIPVNIRLYQEGKESLADNVQITTSDQSFSTDVDVLINGSAGVRTLVIDGYDPDHDGEIENAGGFIGDITVWAIPVKPVITDSKSSGREVWVSQ